MIKPSPKFSHPRLAGLGRRTLDNLGTEFADDANYHGPTPWDEGEKVPLG